MIKGICVTQYRKLKNLSFGFSKNLNAISGTNGTCKTSLLHIISNAFQSVNKTCLWVKDDKCLRIISAVNSVTNPKVESLTRGDKQYNDPAHGKSGILFTVNYFDRDDLGFRRHNSVLNNRYAVKPMYKRGSGDALPCCPVIYLGLSRLVPFGEFQNDDALTGVKKALPLQYQQEVSELYLKFTHYAITYAATQQMGDLKTRAEFSSDTEGIDSNTISAGEDNLYIILAAVVSLKYYFESIDSTREVESVLLIDELDATLHPAFQIKLLRLLREYSEKYKIQVIFTTHSMSALEHMLEVHDNVIYLVDNITSVAIMEEPDINKIKMHLSSLTDEDIYKDKVIPIFTEDAEARLLLNMLLSFFEESKGEGFRGIRRFFHIVNASIGAESLQDIFKDSKLLRMTMKSICILDGDHNSDLSNGIIALPGRNKCSQDAGLSPEHLLIDYAKLLFDADDPFWINRTIIDRGYGKSYYLEKISSVVNEYECKHATEHAAGQHSTIKPREFYKKLFNQEICFFELLFKHWLHNLENVPEIERFYSELRILFKRNAPYNEINPNEWK